MTQTPEEKGMWLVLGVLKEARVEPVDADGLQDHSRGDVKGITSK